MNKVAQISEIRPTSAIEAPDLKVNAREVFGVDIDMEVPAFSIVRKCRGAEYRITVANKATGKPARLVVDGKPIEGTLVPYAKAGSVVTVACEV